LNQAEKLKTNIRAGYPDFSDLPWMEPLSEWHIKCPYVVEAPKGPSRHPVIFINYSDKMYAVKELPLKLAEQEFHHLVKMIDARIPSVAPVGYAHRKLTNQMESLLITRYLDYSIPFRSLFMSTHLARYRDSLLDAIASLMVQVHLGDIYWGDCSLANTLFRRDAGALRAYLVDAETAESYPQDIPALMRHQDLEIMEENINGELSDLNAEGYLSGEIPFGDVGTYIRLRYQQLWEEITRDELIAAEDGYRIQERIRALNALGFSVSDVELFRTPDGNQLRLRSVVSDRYFHHDQLLNLTGIDAEERQAQKMMNEIQELKATLSNRNNRSTPTSAAAYYWQKNIYEPTIERLKSLIKGDLDEAELYCQVLEHKWYLSEKAQRDVGHQTATEDYISKFSPK
jgi:hypothetical protein